MRDKTVLITGASSGIGAACTKIFAAQGANLLLCARRQDRLENIAETLKKQHGVRILPLLLDITDSHSVQKIFSHLPPEWRAIDILINNAGLALGIDKLYEGNIEDWDKMIDTNLKGLLYITRIVLPDMIKRNQGHIINIGSISGHQVYIGGGVYCATKHAVRAITDTLKREVLGTKIRVSSVDPGAVETEFSEVRFKGDSERAKQVYAGFTPLTADDIADAVFYCATRPPHVNIREMIILPIDQSAVDKIHKIKD